MSDVIGIGRRTGPFLADPVHVVHVDPEDIAGDLVAVFDMVKYHVDRDGQILMVFPDRLAPEIETPLRIVRSSLGARGVLMHATTLPPLAADVLMTLLAAVRPQVPNVAALAAALPMLEQQILHFTWLSSVAGLTHPAPSVGQHARSLLPGGSWMVRSWPELAVERFDLSKPFEVPRASQEVGVALADLDGDRSWIDPLVGTHIANPVSVEVEPSADARTWWGCDRVAQLVLYPRDIDRVVSALAGVLDIGRCRWCGETVGSATCPWCRLPRGGMPLGQNITSGAAAEEQVATWDPTGDTGPAVAAQQHMERTQG
ncbi:hypothetical protein [Euzebya tangerina]|uniref:hypothetical protein n=1 Tax=Euzebya tangerina TaxID=591198 RepID=UPI0013C2EBCE|nr:hypothetical protein [Euzebya tangerina]